MKRLMMLSAVLLMALTGLAQPQASNNLYWSMTVDVKMDKRLEWEKKIVAFTKTHLPQAKFRVWEVLSGENSGSYVVVVGPMNFKSWETPMVSPKGDALMKADGQAMDALCNSVTRSFSKKQEDISRMKADRKLKYLVMTTNEINPGTWDDVHDILAKRKESREKGGSILDIDYFRPYSSGNSNAFSTVRFCEKMEELDVQENLTAMFDKAFGTNASYISGMKYNSMIVSTKAEMRMLREDLSSL